MDFTLSNEFMKCLGEIEKETNGSWFCNVEEKSAVGGVVVISKKYNNKKILAIINKFKKKHKIEFNHLMVGEKVILIQFDVKGV